MEGAEQDDTHEDEAGGQSVTGQGTHPAERRADVAAPFLHYRPIGDYGVIGDGRSAALVSSDGSVDWWCPSRFDSPSVFAAILDSSRGGRFRVSPAASSAAHMRYVPDTNILETTYRNSSAAVKVRDFCPFHTDTRVEDAVLVRRIEGLGGEMELVVHLDPRFDYGRVMPRFVETEGGLLARGAGQRLLLSGIELPHRGDGGRRGTLVVRNGESVDLVLRHCVYESGAALAPPPRSAAELERLTLERWRAWATRTTYDGPYAEAVQRAALTLKLLQHEPTGAIVAAPTTSLPEAIGGVRNWDYRYTWIRDAAFSARALFMIGHEEEPERFVSWIVRHVAEDPSNMRVLYSVGGERHLEERELHHLEGYRRSRPVRVGNEASTQHQLDMYGELLDCVHHLRHMGFDVESPRWDLFRNLANYVLEHWRHPDQGIWEMRSPPRHFVLSKAMAWVALDRAVRAAREANLRGRVDEWERTAAEIHREVLVEGYDDALGAFKQAYDYPVLDASNLLLPIIGFIDARDPRMISTVDRTLEILTVNGLVYRYLDAEDGLPGGEATFAYCTFWLIEVLAMQGRLREARALMDRMLGRATHLGLYAEEIDATTGEHLGNFPQGFPHIGLISAALAIRDAERERDGSESRRE